VSGKEEERERWGFFFSFSLLLLHSFAHSFFLFPPFFINQIRLLPRGRPAAGGAGCGAAAVRRRLLGDLGEDGKVFQKKSFFSLSLSLSLSLTTASIKKSKTLSLSRQTASMIMVNLCAPAGQVGAVNGAANLMMSASRIIGPYIVGARL
jgi:hypothetical protein